MKLDYTEGRLFTHNKQWYLDAEPQVLVLFQRLFPSSKVEYQYGLNEEIQFKYTHRPRVIQDTLNVRKDILWFLSRFNIIISDADRKSLQNGARRYDKKIRDAKACYFEYHPVNLDFVLPLRKYQEQAVSLALHKKGLLIADQVGLGKSQPLDSKILTPDGWKNMADIQIGFKVISLDGKPKNVIGIYPQGEIDVFRIYFSDGSSTECSEDHLWKIQTRWNRTKRGRLTSNGKVMPLRVIKEKLRNINGCLRYFIPICEPVEFKESNLPIDPYLIGLFLGDGGISGGDIRFTSADDYIIQELEKLIPSDTKLKYKDRYDYKIVGLNHGKNSLTNIFRSLDMMGKKSIEKSIPKTYLYNSIPNRKKLLQGLMDTDGYVCPKDNHLDFYTSSKLLAVDFKELIRSLGGIAKIRDKKTKLNGKSFNSFRVSIQLPDTILPFKLPRKLSNYHSRQKYLPYRAIIDVEYTGKKKCQCIKIDSPDGLYLTDEYIVTHNTPIGIAIGSKNLPCVCVVPPHLVSQWEFEIKKFLPKARVYTVRSWKKITRLPKAEFYIDAYSRIFKGVDFLLKLKPKTLILDEVHSLRHDTTLKYESIKHLAESCTYKIGLSATPIMNYGNELFNIYQILDAGCVGDANSFFREWCELGKIRDPELLGNFLRKNFLMVRRTRREVGMEIGEVNRIVYNVDADMETLHELEKEAKVLAMKVITGDFKDSGSSAREFDYMLRHATGVAKAKAVAEVVKMVVDSGEKVVLFGWHRDVYDIWLRELHFLNPVMYTGSESIPEKEASLKLFIEGDAKVFIISLRSGAGINGLQLVSSYCIFGELDWSAGIIDQCIGRLWRDGQKEQVTAMFVTIEDGADPIMKQVIGAKAMEAKRIINPEGEVLANTGDREKILGLAKEWLKRQGVDVDSILEKKETEQAGELYISEPIEGMPGYDVWHLLKSSVLSVNDEARLQEEIEKILKSNNIVYEREFALSDRSRVDFKIGNLIIECKAGSFNKRSMLRQIKRYIIDSDIKVIIIVSPVYMKSFMLKEIPIYVVNSADSSLLVGGLS